MRPVPHRRARSGSPAVPVRGPAGRRRGPRRSHPGLRASCVGSLAARGIAQAEFVAQLQVVAVLAPAGGDRDRSEEHTSELQSLMRISYAVFCLIKKKKTNETRLIHQHMYTLHQQ